MSVFETLLKRDGTLVYKTSGVSMLPMLRQNRDLVVIRAPVFRPRRYDVVLYRRGRDHVLHRIIRDRGDHYLIRGDNTYVLERVPAEDVIGVLTAFKRDGREHRVTDWTYIVYSRLWCASYPVRALYRAMRRRLGLLRRKLRQTKSGPSA